MTETSCECGAAKHCAQLDFRGAGAFGDEVSLTGRHLLPKTPAANPINRVAPKDKAPDVAQSLAHTIAANPPPSMPATLISGSLRERGYVPAGPDASFSCGGFREAALALKDKREPGGFKGR